MTVQFLRRSWVRLLAGVLISLLVYVAALRFGWLSSVDRKIYDLGLSLRMPVDEPAEVVLVALDKRAAAECLPQPTFPVSRHLRQHAQLVAKLDSAGASLIVFDILFDSLGTVDTGALRQFVATVKQTGKVVLAGAIERVRAVESGAGVLVSQEKLSVPPKDLRTAAAGLGLINVPVDADGCVRRCYVARQFEGQRLFSLAAEAARLHSRTHPPPDTAAEFYIDYASFGGAISVVSYAEILNDTTWPSRVQGCIALIGVANNGTVDTYKAPVISESWQHGQRLSGSEIHTLAIQTLLAGAVTRRAAESMIFGIGTLLLLVLAFLLVRLRAVFGVIVSLSMMLMIIVWGLISTAALHSVFPVGALLLSIIGGTLSVFALNLVSLRGQAEAQEKIITDIETDLKAAHTIYENLQPREFHLNENVQISALQIPCKQVGGDYYDVVSLTEDGIGLLIADVSGKGVSGSLIMSNLQGQFRYAAREILSPAAMLAEFNKSVAQSAGTQSRFVTLFYGVLDCRKMHLVYANAGHCYPILCSGDGHVELLTEGGPLLGPFPDLVWTDTTIELEPGDVLCLYTDGISEAGGDEPQKQFGEDRVVSCLQGVCQNSAEEIKNHIFESCQQFVRRQPFDDDWTLLVLKVTPNPS